MALAQYVAGMGFSNVGLGIVHSMAHALGAVYDTPHGVANAILLPTVMEFNADATGDKYKYIAIAMGVKNVESFSDKNLIVEVNDERLIIEGEGINITNLDLESGSLAADGKINALKYASKKSAASFFKSIFK